MGAHFHILLTITYLVSLQNLFLLTKLYKQVDVSPDKQIPALYSPFTSCLHIKIIKTNIKNKLKLENEKQIQVMLRPTSKWSSTRGEERQFGSQPNKA